MQPQDATMAEARSLRYLLKGQAIHAGLAVLLVAVAQALAAPELGPAAASTSNGELWLGVDDRCWFWLTVTVALAHQTIVALVFRAQLGWGTLSRIFGRHDLLVWGIVFMPFLIARPLLILATALADAGSLAIPPWLALALGIALLPPVLYAAWSVGRYFGLPRALGGDHFRIHYREMPMVREGAFAWTPNAMYLIVFLGLWSVALLCRSHVALVAALFQHAYIWVHFLATEKPDMDLMYGNRSEP
jgi:hypothetical protein